MKKLAELNVKSGVLFKKLTEAVSKDDIFDREKALMDWIGRMENFIHSIGQHWMDTFGDDFSSKDNIRG